jgi:RimJ/RimL family protein N-acetyltransferase
MSEFFETERLIVRSMEYSDLDTFAALCADPIAMQYMGDGETLDRATVEKWISVCQKKYAERGYGTSAVVEKESGKFIGFCGVIRASDKDFDEIVYAIAQEFWGKGYATEAAKATLDYVFGISEVSEIYATIHAKNEASIKMMAKLGMEYEKTEIEEDGEGTAYYLIRRS